MLPGMGIGRDKQADHREFESSENSLYDIVMMDVYRHTFVQTYRISNTDSDLRSTLEFR